MQAELYAQVIRIVAKAFTMVGMQPDAARSFAAQCVERAMATRH